MCVQGERGLYIEQSKQGTNKAVTCGKRHAYNATQLYGSLYMLASTQISFYEMALNGPERV
jgi:hypothetical protein